MTQDWRLAWRALRARPGTSLLCILLLALGIGLATAIGAIAWHVLFKPLPFAAPDRLVFVWDSTPERPLTNLTPGRLVDFGERMPSFAATAGIGHLSLTLTGRGAPERFQAVSVSSNFFEVLGVTAARGRVFHAGEQDRRVVVFSDGLWRRRFGADPAVVGATLTFDGQPHTVAGVMPADFHWATITPSPVTGPHPELWVMAPANDLPGMPVAYQGDLRLNRRTGYLRAVARLKPGSTLEEAQVEATTLSAQLAREYPATDESRTATLVTAERQLLGHVRLPVMLLIAAAMLLLTGACLNVANLQLMRLAVRRRDLAVQAALGAATGRIVRQIAAELLIIAIAGGLGGLVLAAAAVPLFQAAVPMEIPRLGQVAIGWRDAMTAGAIAAVCGLAMTVLLSGSSRVRRFSFADRSNTMRVSTRGRRLLVGAEVATAVVLVAGALLFARSLAQLQRVDVGIPGVDRLLTFNLVLAGERRAMPAAQRVAFYEQVLQQVRALPGVEHAAAAATLPIGGDDFGTSVLVEGGVTEEPRATGYQVVSSGWFDTLGMRILGGRDFTPADHGDAPPVVIVNQAFADQHWPGREAVGRRLKSERGAPWSTVIGVVSNIRHHGPKRPPRPEVYEPQYRTSFSFTAVAVRTIGDPVALIAPIRAELARLDAAQPISGVATMEEHLARAHAETRSLSSLTSVFGLMALAIAALGIYGTQAFAVAQRRREFGVRLALGATPSRLGRQVLREALFTAAGGVAVGVSLAAIGARAVQALLFETPPSDATTYAAAAALLCGVALAAAYGPARHAMRADPATVLRAE